MQCHLFMRFETMNKEKRKPHSLAIPQLNNQIELENVRPQIRYLWELTTAQEAWLNANVWDTYYNTTLWKLRVRRVSWWSST
jgi:hypothetical protein